MVQTAGTGGADIHAGTFPDSFQSFQYYDFFSGILTHTVLLFCFVQTYIRHPPYHKNEKKATKRMIRPCFILQAENVFGIL